MEFFIFFPTDESKLFFPLPLFPPCQKKLRSRLSNKDRVLVGANRREHWLIRRLHRTDLMRVTFPSKLNQTTLHVRILFLNLSSNRLQAFDFGETLKIGTPRYLKMNLKGWSPRSQGFEIYQSFLSGWCSNYRSDFSSNLGSCLRPCSKSQALL